MSLKWWRWLYRWLLLQTTAVDYARPCSFGWRCWACANVCQGYRPRHRPPAIGVWPNCRWRLVSCLNRYRRRLTRYSRGSNRHRTMTNSSNCHRETAKVRGTTTIRGPDQRCRLFEQIDFIITHTHHYYCFFNNFIATSMTTISSAVTGTGPKLAGSLKIYMPYNMDPIQIELTL